MPSTAVSNTSRRCSSFSRRVSFASRTRSSAASASSSAAAFSASASAVARCAWVLAIWFDRMRAATPTPSRPMISTDCTPSIPRAASQRRDDGQGGTGRHHRDAREHRSGPSTRLLLHARLVSGGVDDQSGERERAQHERDVDGRGGAVERPVGPLPSERSGRRGHGGEDGEQQQVRAWSGATATRRRTPRSGPRSATAKIPAAHRRCTSASIGRSITYSRAVSEAVIEEDVDADLAPVAHLEVLAVLRPGRPHDRDQEEREREVARDRARTGPDRGSSWSGTPGCTAPSRNRARPDRRSPGHPRPLPTARRMMPPDRRHDAGDQRLGGEGLLVENRWGRRGRSPPRPRRRGRGSRPGPGGGARKRRRPA